MYVQKKRGVYAENIDWHSEVIFYDRTGMI